MTTFLHITDLHLVAGEAGITEKLDRLIALIAGATPPPDFVIASGDLTDRGDAESYALLADKMAVLQMPILYALGNHDKRAPFRAAFPGHKGAPDDPLDYDRVCAGCHVIVLDTSRPGITSGGLDEAQMAYLETALTRHEALPKLLVMHHPPATGAARERGWAILRQADSAALAETLQGSGVQMIFCGHIHMNRLSQWHGLTVVNNIGLHSLIDPAHGLSGTGGMHITDGPGFGMCRLTPAGVDVAFADLDPRPTIKRVPETALQHLK